MAKQKSPAPAAAQFSRVERMLAYALVSIIGLSLICFAALLIGYATKAVSGRTIPAIWQTVILLPDIGFPIGLILLIILLVMVAVRRSRAAKDAGK